MINAYFFMTPYFYRTTYLLHRNSGRLPKPTLSAHVYLGKYLFPMFRSISKNNLSYQTSHQLDDIFAYIICQRAAYMKMLR